MVKEVCDRFVLVLTAQAGTQGERSDRWLLDPRLRRGDDSVWIFPGILVLP